MIKLVATYHPDILPDTHLHLAKVHNITPITYIIVPLLILPYMVYRSWRVIDNTDKLSITLLKLMNGSQQ